MYFTKHFIAKRWTIIFGKLIITKAVWFYYDKNREKLLVTTSKISKKTKKSSQKTNSIFSIDDENFPYKGVKCKGSVTIVEDPNRTF